MSMWDYAGYHTHPVTPRVLPFPSRMREKLRARGYGIDYRRPLPLDGEIARRNGQFDKRKSTAGHQRDKSSFLFATEATQNQGARVDKTSRW